MWWYNRPQFIILIALSMGWRSLSSGAISFAWHADPCSRHSGCHAIQPLDSAYLQNSIASASFFPNTYETITEIARVPLFMLLQNTSGSVEMGLLGILGLLLWAFRHPVLAVAYGPIAIFGLLNYVIGNRAIFYSAPMLWFGVAYLVASLCRFITTQLAPASATNEQHTKASIGAAIIAALMAVAVSPTDYVPRQSFPMHVVTGFSKLETVDGVVATWWDYGYISALFNGLPIFHDGGSQTTPVTHFVARSLLEDQQTTSVGILKLLSDGGTWTCPVIRAGPMWKRLKDGNKSSPDIFLAVTGQMAGWMGSISTIGNWDIETESLSSFVTTQGDRNSISKG